MNLISTLRLRGALLILTRFVAALCITLWVGGLAFFGIMAAPVLFHPERSNIPRPPEMATLAPQMVSAMLTRFGTLTTLCAIVLLACLLLDGALSRANKSWKWRAQAIMSLLSLGMALYLNRVLLPQTVRDQAQILPLIARAERHQTLSPAQLQQRAVFDAGHSGYQRLASINLYLLLAILLLLIARGGETAALPVPNRSAKL